MELNQKQKIINLVLTLIQYSTLAAFLVMTPYIANGLLWQILELVGVILGVWAIMVMKKSKINIAPQPRANAYLVTNGPYRLIRHPMYMAIILTLTPLMATHYDQSRMIILGVLFINLIFKLLFEEGLLKEYFDGYSQYMKKSWRLIPLVF
ncbi:MAG: isoprenylcysteine carboxylmethyltransferase family protein [Bacteroidales bacterium]|nr:isoprenylcysteine carboxylmethyltransferase family protein [Bacteroidales bacterium]